MIDQDFINRALSDTGFFCRRVLGMDTDNMSGKKTDKGTGGVRDHGPHQELVSALDDEDVTLLLALMPRNSYKSSIVMGRIMREILSNPNCTVLLCMHDIDKAVERCQTIRDALRDNAIVRELYGDIRGSVWRKDSFITSLRTNRSLLDPTFSCCSRDSLPTGGHYSLIIMDDIIDDQAVKTADGVESSRRALAYLMPLRTIGGKLVDIGTLYAEDDVHDFLLRQPQWKKVIHEVGFELVEDEQHKMTLSGENPQFPFLTKKFLLDQLSIMGPRIWLSQYKNRLIGTGNEVFRAEQFQPVPWKNEYRNLTGYLLMDTATSEKQEGCFSVLLYVGLDERLRTYILDCQVGHFPVHDFVDRFFRMRDRWSGKVSHHAECMEVTALSLTYRSHMERKAKEKKQYLNFVMMPRGSQNDLTKDQRIMKLQPRFQAREVFVCNDTVPREFVDLGETKVLWNPEKVNESTGLVTPAGELVRQFTSFRQWGKSKRDIPDAMAMIDEIDPKTGERFCFYRRPSHLAPPDATVRRKLQSVGRNTGPNGVWRRKRRAR